MDTEKPKGFLQAINDGDLAAVIAALDGGADVEIADIYGYPGLPLRTACFFGFKDVVIELLRRGADINAANADGPGAPLRMARRGQQDDIVRLLEEYSAPAPRETADASPLLPITLAGDEPMERIEDLAPPENTAVELLFGAEPAAMDAPPLDATPLFGDGLVSSPIDLDILEPAVTETTPDAFFADFDLVPASVSDEADTFNQPAAPPIANQQEADAPITISEPAGHPIFPELDLIDLAAENTQPAPALPSAPATDDNGLAALDFDTRLLDQEVPSPLAAPPAAEPEAKPEPLEYPMLDFEKVNF